MTIEAIDHQIDSLLRGVANDVRTGDLPDIFWLMGWADWTIEREFMVSREAASSGSHHQTPPGAQIQVTLTV